MPKPRDIKDEHLEWLLERLREDTRNETQIGQLFREEFPGVFPDTTRARNIAVHLKRQAVERGIELPKTMKGGKVNVPPAFRAWIDDTPELILSFSSRVLVLSDAHFPEHSERAVRAALETAEELEIDRVVWNGDTFDNAYKGHKNIRSVYAAPSEVGIDAATEVMRALWEAGVREQVILQGNHDDKPMRGTDGEWRFTDFLEARVLCKAPPGPAQRFLTTNRYYATMRPQKPAEWPWDGPENFPWIFTHQKNYGKNQLSVAQEIASIELGNIVSGHQHHLAVGRHKSGRMFVCDAGTLQQPDLPAYKNARHSRHPRWACGFLTIIDGVPRAWPIF